MRGGAETRDRLLAVLVAIAVVAGLKATYPVTMPLAVAAVIVAASWPLKPAFDRVMPSAISYLALVLVLVLVALAFLAGIYFSAAEVVGSFAANQDRFQELYGAFSDWLARNGLPRVEGQRALSQAIGLLQGLLSTSYTTLAYIGFIAVLVILGLPEVPVLRRKLQREMARPERRETLAAIEESAQKIRQYIAITTVASIITGVASALWAFAVGLDLALAWGALNFLLNFVPVIGNVIGIIPPSLYALIQFGGWEMPLVVFLGYAVLQIAISYFVYPFLQGRSLSLSPVAVIVALTFWGWLWGIAGALIAVPMTVTLLIVARRFPATAWMATLLSDEDGADDEDDAGDKASRR